MRFLSFLVPVKLHNLSFVRDDEGNEFTDSLLRATLFNYHFTNIHKTVPLTKPVCANNDFLYAEHLAKLSNIPNFSIPFVTVDYVETQLKLLVTTKATGIDNTNAKYLKFSAAVIAPVLTHIFTCKIKTSVFPSAFKVGNVIQIYKTGDKFDKTNYRPISILPVLSLIFERHVNLHF